MTNTSYVIDDENMLPFGMLNNNFDFEFKLGEENWSNCSQYIYVNALKYVLNYNTFFNYRKDKYIEKINKSPTYSTYMELLETISNDIKYNFYYSDILSKLLSEKGFDDFMTMSFKEQKYDDILSNVLESIKINLTIKQDYNFYPSYIVIKIITQFLLDELEDFTKIQQYLQIIENKKSSNIIHDIIKDYDFVKLQKLPVYDFEYEIQTNKELLKVLELSHCYPNILFIYAFKYNLRHFKNRMEFKYRNKIFELFLKYKNKYTESIKKEIYLVHNRKLKDIILEQVLKFDDKFRKYIDKDAPLRQIISSKISDDKIVDYENFNFFDINDNSKVILLTKSNPINKASSVNSDFFNYLKNLELSFENQQIYPANLERVKQVLATIAIHKKFDIPLPQNQLDNYNSNLPVFLKNHVSNFNQSIEGEDEKIKSEDMKFVLYLTRGINLQYQTDDSTLSSFVGQLLTNLAMTSSSLLKPNDTTKGKANINTLLQDDLFMKIWIRRQLQYMSHFLASVTLFLDINSISLNSEAYVEILKIFSDNINFNKLKTIYDEVPIYFCELLEYYFDLSHLEKKSFSVLMWNFTTFNLQNILKTRDVIKTKSFIIKSILRLRQFHQCVENPDNNDIACYAFAIINVANKFEKLIKQFNIARPTNVDKFVQAVILNTKTIDVSSVSDDVDDSSDSKDVGKIVEQIFVQNVNVIKSYISQKQIVDLINTSIKNEEQKYKINMWVSLTF